MRPRAIRARSFPGNTGDQAQVIGLAPLDYALMGIVLLSSIVGVLRGFFREAMSLLVWAGAIWIAARHGHWLAPYLGDLLPGGPLRLWAARLVLLLVVLIAGGLTAWILGMLLHSTRLAGADRVFGMVFGLVRGLLLAGLVIIALRVAGFDNEPWWRQSKLIPYAAPVADALRQAAEQGLRRSSLQLLFSSPDLPTRTLRPRS